MSKGNGYYVTVYDECSGNFRPATDPTDDLDAAREAAGALKAEGRIAEIDWLENGIWAETVEKLHTIPSTRL